MTDRFGSGKTSEGTRTWRAMVEWLRGSRKGYRFVDDERVDVRPYTR